MSRSRAGLLTTIPQPRASGPNSFDALSVGLGFVRSASAVTIKRVTDRFASKLVVTTPKRRQGNEIASLSDVATCDFQPPSSLGFSPVTVIPKPNGRAPLPAQRHQRAGGCGGPARTAFLMGASHLILLTVFTSGFFRTSGTHYGSIACLSRALDQPLTIPDYLLRSLDKVLNSRLIFSALRDEVTGL